MRIRPTLLEWHYRRIGHVTAARYGRGEFRHLDRVFDIFEDLDHADAGAAEFVDNNGLCFALVMEVDLHTHARPISASFFGHPVVHKPVSFCAIN